MAPCPFLLGPLLVVTGTAGARMMMRKDEVATRQAEAAKRWQCSPGPAVSSSTNVKRGGPQNITFTNPEASKFWVNGSALPFWAGLLPISNNSNETRQDKRRSWCSSLEGLLQENGVVSGPTYLSLLWIEQPVGTGFSQGTPNIENEDQLAEQLVGFLQQFLEVFSELKGKKPLGLLVKVSHIANYIYENPTLLDLSLQGMWISDPSLSWDVVQEEIPAVDFVHKYQGLFSFNQTFLDYLDQTAAACNYTNYVSTYVTYPPNGLLPLPGNSVEFADGCDVWDDIFYAALIINPAFNIYRIWDTYPILWDVLGFPGSFPQKQSPIYFNRREVKEAIHAPLNTHWAECSNVNVFPNGDQSLPPAFTVLPNVIEKNVRTVIVHGVRNGLQGFQTPIANDSFVVDGVGAYGNMHSERGLTYYEVALSGHMAAFQIMQDTP
ncbi:Alpha/Beta hydrolase protein [Boletus edulis]|nr:Alpha/Beta hydrolase protein [Boletus edulis]